MSTVHFPKTTALTPSTPPRASFIVPIPTGKKAWAERTIERLLAARFHGLPRIEIVAVDDETREEAGDYLKGIFGEAIKNQELHITTPDRSGDLGALKNHGARNAQARILVFLHPGELWEAPHLVRALENASQSDLQFGFKAQTENYFDALTFHRKPIWKSSVIVERKLWELAGGFPEGYTGFPAPSRIPGEAVAEFLIRAHPHAKKISILPPEVMSEWSSPGPPPIPEILFPTEKLDSLLRGLSLIRASRTIPREVWKTWGARLAHTTATKISERLKLEWNRRVKPRLGK